MSRRRRRRWGSILTAALLFGCAAEPSRVDRSPRQYAGLETIDTRFPGVLLVRPDHHMGSYDHAMVDPIVLSYRRTSQRFSEEETERLREYLRESSARELANVDAEHIVDEPGPCVLRLQTAFVDLELAPPPSEANATTTYVDSFGAVTLVHQIVDSQSGRILLRYIGRRRAPGGLIVGGGDPWTRMTRTFDDMLESLQQNLIESVPHSVATSGPRAACRGELFQHIQEERPDWRPRGAD